MKQQMQKKHQQNVDTVARADDVNVLSWFRIRKIGEQTWNVKPDLKNQPSSTSIFSVLHGFRAKTKRMNAI